MKAHKVMSDSAADIVKYSIDRGQLGLCPWPSSGGPLSSRLHSEWTTTILGALLKHCVYRHKHALGSHALLLHGMCNWFEALIHCNSDMPCSYHCIVHGCMHSAVHSDKIGPDCRRIAVCSRNTAGMRHCIAALVS